jgi:RNA polymerase sigma factor (sigma-70 family)
VTLGDEFPRILEAGRSGELWALERLYRELAPAVLGYLRGQGAVEPEDLTSEVFVGLVRGLHRFAGDERGFRSWIFAIAHRRLLDERRRLSRRREEPMDPGKISENLAGASTGDAEEEALIRLEGPGVLRMLAGLSPDQRSVLLLRVVADLSVEEVARILGKSRGAVKSLQRRALLSLARQSDSEGVS